MSTSGPYKTTSPEVLAFAAMLDDAPGDAVEALVGLTSDELSVVETAALSLAAATAQLTRGTR
jgi:hypothetical protein